METAPEEDKVTAPVRDRISAFRDGGMTQAEAIPPGRFFRDAEGVWRQRFRIGPDFPLFQGHFPGHPVLPALGHVILARSVAEFHDGRSLAATEIVQAKFLAPVEPGAMLEVFMAPPRESGGPWLFQTFVLSAGVPTEAARIKMLLAPDAG